MASYSIVWKQNPDARSDFCDLVVLFGRMLGICGGFFGLYLEFLCDILNCVKIILEVFGEVFRTFLEFFNYFCKTPFCIFLSNTGRYQNKKNVQK